MAVSGKKLRELVPTLRADEGRLHDYINEAVKGAVEAKIKHNAYISLVDADRLDDRLRELTSLPDKKKAKLPLYGVPLAVKDNICWKGAPTTCASKILANYRPTYTATVVERLEAAGAVVLGKTNLDEFAFGSSNETSAFGPVTHPRDPSRIPGGSSGGSAVAVAAGSVPLALGSDTGGSTRQPAAFCGVYGLKPTYGRLSRHGLVAFASSMDQIGLFAKNPDDLRLAFEACAGPDSADATSAVPPEIFPENFDPCAGFAVGYVREHRVAEGVQPEVAKSFDRLLEKFALMGCRVVEVSLPSGVHSIAVYVLTALAEASANLARFDGVNYGVRVEDMPDDAVFGPRADRLLRMYAATRGLGFGDEVKRRIMLGTFALAEGYYDAYYLRAQRVRTKIRRELDEAFSKVGLVVSPTFPTTAFKLGEISGKPLATFLGDMFTNPANLAGLPALSVPWGEDFSGLPIGMQLMGPAFSEERLFTAAEALAAVAG
ncbi:MAG: glutaminyl-tRNA synthase (glutamine-hydrolyzing) subunit A [Candidatus Coatesbacteria bacterium RBG_13_66_14]|uniref:Glutamyl-tRNA(Gln) amidotransferase subunit A n=1 Tax=Candidatus Coatesbacteria bacterium RBG_13_66_14 TaxID=1817816 RepID=A0A1F5F5W5_9BACT|nr:MAG: glutaminyl-tRNA synthase (glutamine-hydrolyzing) subunit A [Candidatus Coatesbacteria bacterium RBG_13_66_14]